jgi:signal transduction histidine kinase
MRRVGIERWLTVAGFATWLVSGLPMLVRFVNGAVSSTTLFVWAIAFPLFGVAFGLICLDRPGMWQQRRVRRLLIAIQAGAGLAMTATSPDVFPAGTLVVVAGQLDEFSPRVALVWMTVQTLAIAQFGFAYVNSVIAVAIAGAFGGFQVFAFVMASLASSERVAREQLTRAHGELLATRALLAESSRNEERLRISRDLHDTLGHHLTALSLQLDVASRLTDGKGAEHVRHAHAITRLLLSCVQEVITNATRHAAADNLWLALTVADDGMRLCARDDGRGATAIVPGHGLTGMRERFEALGGRVEFRSGGRGFEVEGYLPRTS